MRLMCHLREPIPRSWQQAGSCGRFQEEGEDYYYQFSIRRDLLEKMLKDYAVQEYVKEENGEIMMTQKGPRLLVKGRRLQNGEIVDYYSIPREELDNLMNLIEEIDFAPRGGSVNEVLVIIEEEMEGYLKGDKTLKEATEIIQNRVQILVQERM